MLFRSHLTWRFIKYSDAKAPRLACSGALASEYFMNRQVLLIIHISFIIDILVFTCIYYSNFINLSYFIIYFN